MASTRKATNYGDPFPTAPMANVGMKREFELTLAAAIVVNDLFKLCPIKAVIPLVIDDYYVDVPDIDEATGSVIALGDNTTADVFVTGSTKGRAAAIITPEVDGTKGVLPKLYTADNDFVLKCTTAPTTSATTGVFRGWMEYHHVGIASVL